MGFGAKKGNQVLMKTLYDLGRFLIHLALYFMKMDVVKFLTCLCIMAHMVACDTPSKRPALQQLTSLEGNETRGRVSPDGKTVVFQYVNKGNSDILLLNLETKEVTPFAHTPDSEEVPSWSPMAKKSSILSSEMERISWLKKDWLLKKSSWCFSKIPCSCGTLTGHLPD